MTTLPGNFLWGTSQSGHQIEGENFNSDWWHWEQRPGRIVGGGISKEAAGHYRRFEEDYDLAKRFGGNAVLFSIEWARIQPKPGQFDPEAIAHYRQRLEALHTRNLEPICVMQHVTLPRWFADRYGWHHRKAPALFDAYAQHVAKELAPLCQRWIPIREPMHYITMAYFERAWPPASRKLARARMTLINIAQAHAHAYDALHNVRDDVQVGAAIHTRTFSSLDENSPWDIRAQLREERRCNRIYLDALTTGRWPLTFKPDASITGQLDFVGVSYYGHETLRFSMTKPSRAFTQLTDPDGTALKHIEYTPDPNGLLTILRHLGRYKLPILITANGVATKDDNERCHYLLDHVAVLNKARAEGIDLQGYCYRSLLDGFEWETGYTQRYGLIHVDRITQTRTPNASAFLYKEICQNGTISQGLAERYCPGWQDPTKQKATE